MFDQLGKLSELMEKLKDVDESKMQSFVGMIFGQFLASMCIRAATARPVPEGYLQQMTQQGYDRESATALYHFVLESAIKQEQPQQQEALTSNG